MKLNDELLLGLALATGCFTSLRFYGVIGISEILFFAFIFLGLLKSDFFNIHLEINLYSVIGFVLILSFFLLLPAVTFYTAVFTNYVSTPIYIVSYQMGLLIFCLLILKFNAGFDMSYVTTVFAVVFSLVNLSMIFANIGYDGERFLGLAKNPNQLYFYGSSLLLLSVLYLKKYKFLSVAVTSFILIKSGSDAFLLTLVVVPFSYVFFMVFYNPKFSNNLSLVISFLISILILCVSVVFFSQEMINIWDRADQGGYRVGLYENALLVIMDSPIWGFGAGSFSGLEAFGTTEAHNTFLDLAMQFGVVVPLIIYYIFFRYLLLCLENRHFLIAAFVVAFILSGFFHFNGRHFVFWMELAIFFYAINPKNTSKIVTNENYKATR